MPSAIGSLKQIERQTIETHMGAQTGDTYMAFVDGFPFFLPLSFVPEDGLGHTEGLGLKSLSLLTDGWQKPHGPAGLELRLELDNLPYPKLPVRTLPCTPANGEFHFGIFHTLTMTHDVPL
jgi:hypothetical protein